MTLSPQDYNVISKRVYRLDPAEYPKNKQLKKGDEFKVNG